MRRRPPTPPHDSPPPELVGGKCARAHAAPTKSRATLLTALIVATTVAGCQRGGGAAAQPTPDPGPGIASLLLAQLSPTPSPHAVAPSSHPAPRPSPKPTPRASTQPRPAPRRTATPLCPHVPSVGKATQLVLVRSYGSAATVWACQLRAQGWVSVFGAMAGHVGYNGVAPPGAKREGDGRTPSGLYHLGLGFGTRSDPGLALGWRQVDSYDVWVDDPRSALYNTWQRLPAQGRWDSAESLDQPVPYAYAQVIDYNTARTPGLGSAIFFHVDLGHGTAGCVSLPTWQLLAVMRWERPGALISIS